MSIRKPWLLISFLALSALCARADFAAGTTTTALFQDDFDSGSASSRWQLQPGWEVENDGGNFALSGSGHVWASAGSPSWTNYSFSSKVKLMDAGSSVHVNIRLSGCERYFVSVRPAEIVLFKSRCDAPAELARASVALDNNTWHTVNLVGETSHLRILIDGVPKIDVTDASAPILSGSIAFEVLDNSHVHVDDVVVSTDEPLSPTPWISTGGPVGGLGYDVRIHPSNKTRMYVTDNFAGVARSDNGGGTWQPVNSGISTRSGSSGDAVNIFSLTIDPNNPDIVWSGTNGVGASFGVFKSTDGGTTWVSRTKGMTLSGEAGMVFRGFTIQNGNSNVVYAQAEVPTTVQGKLFNRVKGRVYKTTNGGESWTLAWQGKDLARYLIIDPTNANVLYLSTGIFDREPYDSDCAAGRPAALGVLKSTDGGQSWSAINNGLADLCVGSLRMHPRNPQVLFAAAGNLACSPDSPRTISGLYRTADGGASWTKVIAEDFMTTVNFSPSNPNVMYAGSGERFYRSEDGGTTWSKFSFGAGADWGAPGIRGGVPIDVTVDPDNPYTVYANSYGGGVFRSLDGAATWDVWSKGYSGAEIHWLSVLSGRESLVYAIGRSGPFISTNFGEDWAGIANGTSCCSEWNSIVAQPNDVNHVLIADEHQGAILLSTDGGNHFTLVLKHPGANPSLPDKRQGFRAVAFAPSSPSVVYAGVSIDRTHLDAVTPTGVVLYKSTDGGTSFTPMPSALDGTNIRRIAVAAGSADIVYAATFRGVYKTTNGGAAWTRMASLGERKIEALAIDARHPGLILAGELFGGVWMSTDDGATWTGPRTRGFNSANPYVTSIVFDRVDSATVYASDLYSGTYRSLDKGDTWAPFPDWKMSGLTMRAVKDLAVGETTLYAATQGGGVFRFPIRSWTKKRTARH